MEILTRLSHEEEIYTRQLAALHFPGSLESSGAHNSAFLLQQTREVYSTKSLEEAYPPKEGDQFEYGDPCGDYVTFDSLDALSSIVFTGGEPTLNIEAIRYTLDKCEDEGIFVNSFYVVTNGKQVSIDFLKTMLDWYVFCVNNGGEPEMCGLALSKDNFHERIPAENELLLRGMSFFRDDKFQESGTRWIIAEGRAADIPGARPNEMSYLPELYVYNKDGIDNVSIDDVVYVSADGKVIAGCDWAFENQSKHQLGTVYDQNGWLNALGLQAETCS